MTRNYSSNNETHRFLLLVVLRIFDFKARSPHFSVSKFVWGADEYLDTFYWSQGLVHKDIWEAEFVAKILRHKAMKYKRDVPDIVREER